MLCLFSSCSSVCLCVSSPLSITFSLSHRELSFYCDAVHSGRRSLTGSQSIQRDHILFSVQQSVLFRSADKTSTAIIDSCTDIYTVQHRPQRKLTLAEMKLLLWTTEWMTAAFSLPVWMQFAQQLLNRLTMKDIRFKLEQLSFEPCKQNIQTRLSYFTRVGSMAFKHV